VATQPELWLFWVFSGRWHLLIDEAKQLKSADLSRDRNLHSKDVFVFYSIMAFKGWKTVFFHSFPEFWLLWIVLQRRIGSFSDEISSP